MSELPIDNQTFQRCEIQISCEDPDDQNGNAGHDLADQYLATIRGAFNLEWNLPSDYRNTRAYERCMTIPPNIPYYREPNPNIQFAHNFANGFIPQPDYSSLLPLLIAADRNNINIGQYNIISERNSLSKLAMNNEDYVIGVQRFGPTLFLRHYDRRIVDMTDYGHQFEQMCTPDYHLTANYYQLVKGRFKNLRTLITAETDAISEQNGEAIELKCGLNPNISEKDLSQYWLQAFLGGVTTIVVGYLSMTAPVKLIRNVHQNVADMISNQEKNKILNRLYRILHFLEDQVVENEVYLFSRRIDQRTGRRQLYLYKIVARQDKHKLAFISPRMCGHLSSNNETRRQTSINDDEDDGMDLSGEDSNCAYGADVMDFHFSKMDRLNEKKKMNVLLRRAEHKRKRTN